MKSMTLLRKLKKAFDWRGFWKIALIKTPQAFQLKNFDS